MKMIEFFTFNNGETVTFSDKQGSKVIPKEGFIGNFTVLGRQIYFLNPGCQMELAFLRNTMVDAGYTRDEQKKNKANPVRLEK